MYTGNSHFLFFRLHGLLCERLTIIRDKSIEILNEHKRNENNDLCGEQSAAVTLGMKSILGKFISGLCPIEIRHVNRLKFGRITFLSGVNPEEYYAAFIELVKCYSENTIENSVYEDTLREMFSTKVGPLI